MLFSLFYFKFRISQNSKSNSVLLLNKKNKSKLNEINQSNENEDDNHKCQQFLQPEKTNQKLNDSLSTFTAATSSISNEHEEFNNSYFVSIRQPNEKSPLQILPTSEVSSSTASLLSPLSSPSLLLPSSSDLQKRIKKCKFESASIIDHSLIHINDILLIEALQIIPCDGFIIETVAAAGPSNFFNELKRIEVDESNVTGESIPVQKQKSDFVFGGSKVLNTAILMKATEVTFNFHNLYKKQ